MAGPRRSVEELDALRSYHMDELATARSDSSSIFNAPRVPPTARVVLDIGCGAGQTLLALNASATVTLIGPDMDEDAVSMAPRDAANLHFAVATGEILPIATESCDFVISRVALPYMHLRTALAEISRVLRPGAELWVTLHPYRMIRRQLREQFRNQHWRGAVYQCFIIANSLSLVAFGIQWRYPLNRNRKETFQTPSGMRRELARAGFDVVEMRQRDEQFVVVARRRGAAPERTPGPLE